MILLQSKNCSRLLRSNTSSNARILKQKRDFRILYIRWESIFFKAYKWKQCCSCWKTTFFNVKNNVFFELVWTSLIMKCMECANWIKWVLNCFSLNNTSDKESEYFYRVPAITTNAAKCIYSLGKFQNLPILHCMFFMGFPFVQIRPGAYTKINFLISCMTTILNTVSTRRLE